MKKTMVIVFALCLPAAAAPTIGELLQKIEASHRMTSDIKASVTLTQQKANQGMKQFDVLYYRRDADDSYLIIMTGPESEKGNGYLARRRQFLDVPRKHPHVPAYQQGREHCRLERQG